MKIFINSILIIFLLVLFSQNGFSGFYSNQLIWSTYLGGNNEDYIYSVFVNNTGDIVAVGYSSSNDLPTTTGAYQGDLSGTTDIMVFEFDKFYNLKWGTYYGGDSSDFGNCAASDKNNNIWIGGWTLSKDFPVTSDAFQLKINTDSTNTYDAIFLKLSKQGKRLYSTYCGGEWTDIINNIKIDSNNNVLACGSTNSTKFPLTSNAYQTTWGGTDGFIIKMDETGSLLLCSLLGGDNIDAFYSLTILKDNNLAVCGFSASNNMECPNGYQKKRAGFRDGYIAKLEISNGKPIWGTYFGGSKYDYADDILVDKNNNIICTGHTESLDFPVTIGAYQVQNNGNENIFIAKFTDDGDIIWSTYFGGEQSDYSFSISIDESDDFVITGSTRSKNFPVTKNSLLDTLKGQANAYITIFNPDCKLIWSSYLGGSINDVAIKINFIDNNTLICAGGTRSTDFPITDNAFQKTLLGKNNGFITIIGNLFPLCSNDSINYKNFSSTKNLKLINNTFPYNDVICLTSSVAEKVGAVWYKDPVPVNCDFQVNFSFQFKDGSNNNTQENSLPGADGIAFVVQFDNNVACGGNGGGIGYDFIPNSLAVEYDTFQNDSTQIINLNDPNGNHIAVQTNGTFPNSSKHDSRITLGINPNILIIKSDGTIYYSLVEYSLKDKKLSIYLDSVPNLITPVLVIDSLDLNKTLYLDNGSCAYIGFTSATGKAFETHNLLSWSYKNSLNQPLSVGDIQPAQNGNTISFPNPATQKATIKFDLDQPSNISLKLSDKLGNQISLIENQFMDSGRHSVDWDASGYPAGVYYYVLRAGASVKTGKVVVVK
jgi:hypothetical protein